MQRKFRASYSILNAWAMGRHEDAIKYYFKLPTITTPQMKAGSDYHAKWEAETKRTKALPEVFGGLKLIDPQAELFLKAEVNEWLDLVGVIDLYDKPTIYEYKTGRAESEAIARTYQLGVYGVLATLNNLYVERAEVYCYNQYTNSKSMSIVYITDTVLEKSMNWIETLSGDMLEYIKKNDLFNKLGTPKSSHK